MDSTDMTPVTIRSSCDATILAYHQLLQQLPSHELYGFIKIEYDRLKIWAGNIGVYGRPPVSADDRLANDEEMKNLVMKLLLRAAERLQQYLDSYQDASSADFLVSPNSSSSSCDGYLDSLTSSGRDVRLLRNIRRDTGKLFSILALVRQTTNLTSNPKIFTFDFKSWLSDDFGILIEDIPKSIQFQLRLKFNAAPPYGECTLPQDLVESLKKAATIRRKALLLRRRHNRKVHGGADTRFAVLPDRSGRDIASGPVSTELRNTSKSTVALQGEAGSTTLSDTIPSVPAQPLKAGPRHSSAQSAPKSTMSVVLMRNQLDVPRPPRCKPGMPEVDCYICGMALNQTLLQQDRWKKHVLEDIDPFSCLFVGCDEPDLLYKTPDEWYKHMQNHKMEWCCMMPGHRKLTFESESGLETHLLTAHAAKLSRAQVETLLKRGRRATRPLFEDCPLCGRTCADLGLNTDSDSRLPTQDHEATIRALHRHIESHMYELALFCIPPISDVVTVSQSATADRSSGRRSEGDLGQRLSQEGLETLPSDLSQPQQPNYLHRDWEKAFSNDQIHADFETMYTIKDWEKFAMSQMPGPDLDNSEHWLATCKDILERKIEGQDGNTEWRESDENLRATFQLFLRARKSCSSDSQRMLLVRDNLCTNLEIRKAITAELIECEEISISPPNAMRDRRVMLSFRTPEAAQEAFLDINAIYINETMVPVRIVNDAGADIVSQSVTGWRQIYNASRNGHLEIVKTLLEKGADLHITNDNGWTPLCTASSNGHYAVVKYLFEHGANADIHTPTKDGWTPLYAASKGGHLEVVKYLFEHGANGDINTATVDGSTPLYTASYHGYVKVVRYLLEHEAGADINRVTQKGWTPVYAASRWDHLEVMQLLLEAGADVNLRGPLGQTPLICSIIHARKEMAKSLIRYSADITLTDGYGRTAVDWLKLLKSDDELLKSICPDPENSPENPIEINVKSLCASVALLAAEILDRQMKDSASSFNAIGHYLLALDDTENACVAFRQKIKTPIQTVSIQHGVTCDVCFTHPIKGSRFVCKTCHDTDLCESCMEKYHQGKHFAACSGHEFLEVSGSDSVPMERDALRIWLQDLVDQHTVTDRAVDQSHDNSSASLEASQKIRIEILPDRSAESFHLEFIINRNAAQSLIPAKDVPEHMVRRDLEEPDPQTGCTQYFEARWRFSELQEYSTTRERFHISPDATQAMLKARVKRVTSPAIRAWRR